MSELKIPEPDLQISFYHRLQEIRHTHLLDALLTTIANLETSHVDQQLADFASSAGLRKVAGWGLRGELVFAVPHVLTQSPFLLGYYRLLLGFSQKQFYGDRYGLGGFRAMEEGGLVSITTSPRVEDLCRILCRSAEYLVREVEHLSQRSLHELTLLTLGPQLRGTALNMLGNKATQRVFSLIHALLSAETVAVGDRSLVVQNAAGRAVRVEFAADPDICIREELPSGRFRNLVAIEIKGGRDYSNIHNRIGEAEKSHQKAKQQGYVECWTMVGVAHLDMNLARRESPTTDRFYRIDGIIEPNAEEANDFRENLLARLGIRA